MAENSAHTSRRTRKTRNGNFSVVLDRAVPGGVLPTAFEADVGFAFRAIRALCFLFPFAFALRLGCASFDLLALASIVVGANRAASF